MLWANLDSTTSLRSRTAAQTTSLHSQAASATTIIHSPTVATSLRRSLCAGSASVSQDTAELATSTTSRTSTGLTSTQANSSLAYTFKGDSRLCETPEGELYITGEDLNVGFTTKKLSVSIQPKQSLRSRLEDGK
jgi:hypothetical protein